ncbi:MAG: LPS export ABC transporter ATP-binding protein [Planctomycetota bacterium]
MTLLKAEALVKTYDGRRVVNDVTMEIYPGEIVGLLGKNGAGKTTSFRIIVGMIGADAGKVTLKDIDITRLPMYKRARNGMGYLSQEPSVFQKMTVRDNLMAILETLNLTKKQREQKADEIMGELGLLSLAKQRANTLSGGERRRVEIARALVTSPAVMMLDEPFSGVDPIAVEEIKEIISALREKGMGILLTDHNVRETLSITDRSYIIEQGKILREGNSEALVSDQLVRQVYLGEKFTM